jgi:hypothetical protein
LKLIDLLDENISFSTPRARPATHTATHATTHKHARGVEKPMFSLSKSMNFKILIISGRLGGQPDH